MEHLDLPPASFDLAYSSLALHYVADLAGLVTAVHRALAAGGQLIFSVEHPIFTAPAKPGWTIDASGAKTWPIDGYLNEGPRRTNWLTKGVIKQHRTVAGYVNLLLRTGFALTHLEEWGPYRRADRGRVRSGGRAAATAFPDRCRAKTRLRRHRLTASAAGLRPRWTGPAWRPYNRRYEQTAVSEDARPRQRLCRARRAPRPQSRSAPRARARIADRHTGIGCDQLIVLEPPRDPRGAAA